MFLDHFRSDRIFDNVIELKSLEITDDNGLSAGDRKVFLRKLRDNRRARRLASDTAYEKFAEAKEEGFSGGFMEWLIANWSTVLPMILSIIKLFGL